MGEDFYGMKRAPFARNIPTSCIYQNDLIDAAIDRLIYACKNKQFALLIGDTGTGKTTILRYVSEHLLPASDYTIIYMCEQHLTPRMFYNHILVQLGHAHTMQFTNARLAVQREIGRLQKKLVVMIDEGQILPVEMLNEIRFMLNDKMDSEYPFTLIISATSEIWGRLRHESFRSTLNRINIECYIEPFTKLDTERYILSHIGYAGIIHSTRKLFTDDAVAKIFKASKGYASVINRISIQAIMLASQMKYDDVDGYIIDSVLRREMTMTQTT